MTVIYYDLETTGLNNEERQRGVQIVSIGAVTEFGATFHRYIIPTCPISAGATDVHGIELIHGKLFKNGDWKENAVQPKDGLQLFMNWLDSKNAQCLVSFCMQSLLCIQCISITHFLRWRTIIWGLIPSF